MLNKPRGYVTTLKDERGKKMLPTPGKDAGSGFPVDVWIGF